MKVKFNNIVTANSLSPSLKRTDEGYLCAESRGGAIATLLPSISSQYFHPAFKCSSEFNPILNRVKAPLIEQNHDVLKKLIQMRHKDGSEVFDDTELHYLISCLNPFNKNIISKMSDMKSFSGDPLFDSDKFIQIAQNVTNATHMAWADFLLSNKRTPDTVMGAIQIANIQYPNDYAQVNGSILSHVALAETKRGGDRFGPLGMYHIIQNTNSRAEFEKLKEMAEDKDLSTFEIVKHLKAGTYPAPQKILNKYNDNFFKTISVDLSYVKNKLSMYNFMNEHPDHAEKVIEVLKINPKTLSINMNTYDGTCCISDNLLSDIKKYSNGGEFVKEYGAKAFHLLVKRTLPEGDVAKIGDKLVVHDNGELSELAMTKEKFIELFPPIGRFNFAQGELGDCWLISVLDGIMHNPASRAKIYKLFRQDGNDIYLKFKDSANEIKFPNSKVVDNECSLDGPLGFKMIEQAFAIHRRREHSGKQIHNVADIKDMDLQMLNLEGGHPREILKCILEPETSRCKMLLGRDVLAKEKCFKMIEKYSNDKTFLLNFCLSPKFNKKVKYIDSKYNLLPDHSYSIKGYNKENGLVSICNPHKISVVRDVPIYDLLKHFDSLTITQFNITK